LLCIRHLLRTAELTGISLEIKCYEAQDTLGGLWNYQSHNEQTLPDETLKNDVYYQQNGHIQHSMYEDQLVNVPRYFQQFKDFPQPAEMPMFPHRSEWAQYLRRYADHFDLARYVRFSKYVKSVRRSANAPASSLPHGRRPGRFCVAVVDAQSSLHRKAQAKWSFFDWVICANGHNSKPHWPNLEGLSDYDGKITHMHSFRNLNHGFHDKSVLLIGTSYSALDMLVLFFSSHGDDQSGRVKRAHVKKVILCGSLCDKFHTNTDFAEEQRSGRLEFKASPVEQLFRNRTVRFKDGSSASVDIILCCTGYEAHYPMLDKADGLVSVSKEHGSKLVTPLYKRMFCANEPHLVMPGLVDFTPLTHHAFEHQAIVAAAAVCGQVKLPSSEVMNASVAEDLAAYSHLGLKNFHRLLTDELAFGYLHSLHALVADAFNWEWSEKYYVELKKLLAQMGMHMLNGNWVSYRNGNYEKLVNEQALVNTTEFF